MWFWQPRNQLLLFNGFEMQEMVKVPLKMRIWAEGRTNGALLDLAQQRPPKMTKLAGFKRRKHSAPRGNTFPAPPSACSWVAPLFPLQPAPFGLWTPFTERLNLRWLDILQWKNTGRIQDARCRLRNVLKRLPKRTLMNHVPLGSPCQSRCYLLVLDGCLWLLTVFKSHIIEIKPSGFYLKMEKAVLSCLSVESNSQ